MIKLILPVSKVDLHLAALLPGLFKRLTPDAKDRSITVAVCWEDARDTDELLISLKLVFGEVNQFILPDVPSAEGWPLAANHMFYGTAERLHEVHNKSPWFWFEADMVPLKMNWLSIIESEYTRVESATPYWGKINKSRYVNLATGEQFEKGEHLVGAAVYPADFLSRCPSAHYIGNLPFDIHIENDVAPRSYSSALYHHCWNCFYSGDDVQGRRLMSDLKPDPKRHSYAGPIPPEAAVVHGSKTTKLLDLLLQQVTV